MNWIYCLFLSVFLIPYVSAQSSLQCRNNLFTDRGTCTAFTIEGNGPQQQCDHERLTRQVAAALTPKFPVNVGTLNTYQLPGFLTSLGKAFAPVRRSNCPLRAGFTQSPPCCEHVLVLPSSCDPTAPYRAINGQCNNLVKPLWGVTGVNYIRMLTPEYADGISAPRVSQDGSPLPCARRITLNFFFDGSTQLSSCFSALHMQWGQFLDHDITASQDDPDKTACNCCPTAPDGRCFVIPVPPWDRTGLPMQCFPLTRKKPAMNIDCDLGPREHINQQTAYIDASQVYGATKTLDDSLRDTTNLALLRITQNIQTGEIFLPFDLNPNNTCTNVNSALNINFCPLAGDDRVGEHIGLTNMHLFFTLLHNFIARQLLSLRSPPVDQNRVFFDTRRIIGAITQRITYAEYLPTVLGNCVMQQYNLTLDRTGPNVDVYDPTVNPGIITEFAGAAFRYGHSSVMQDLQLWSLGRNSAPIQSLQLATMFFHVQQDNTAIQQLIKGLSQAKMGKIDAGFSNSVRNQLFLDTASRRALDLSAINIQRGRELGIPGYTKYLRLCNIADVTSFADLTKVMDKTVVASLQTIYCDVNDIDLYVGGIAETQLDGGVVGPTFACILGNQFHNLRFGDRYWHERSQEFNPTQLNELRGWTTGRLLSAIFPRLLPLQDRVFELPSSTNPSLDSFSPINLRPFITMN